MEMGTLEVVRSLQSGPFAADTLDRARAALVARGGGDGLDRVGAVDGDEWLCLIDAFADACRDPRVAASAHTLAAELRLRRGERAAAADSYAVALDLDPACDDAFDGLLRLLDQAPQAARLGALLAARAQALRALPQPDEARLAATYRELAQARLRTGDRDGAVAAYDQAIDNDPDVDTIEALAALYLERARPGDEEQAADLYFAIADALDDKSAIGYLERALDVMPDHAEAMERFEALVPVDEQLSRLRQRWVRYIERAGNDPDADDRRVLLSRALAAEGRYRDALLCIAPAADRGDATARALREAYVANLEGQVEEGQAERAQRTSLPPSRALTPRSGATMVGIDLSEHQADGRIGGEVSDVLRQGHAQPVATPVSVAPRSDLPSAPPVVPAAARVRAARKPWLIGAGAVALAALVGMLMFAGGSEPEPSTTNSVAAASAAPTASEPATRVPSQAVSTPRRSESQPAGRATTPSRVAPSVRVVRQAARIRGGAIPRGRVLSQLQRAVPTLRRCYEKALSRKPGLSGRVVYSLTVGRKGRVSGARRVGGTIKDGSLAACGRNALEHLRFPRPKGKPVQIRAPFAFGS